MQGAGASPRRPMPRPMTRDVTFAALTSDQQMQALDLSAHHARNDCRNFNVYVRSINVWRIDQAGRVVGWRIEGAI